MKIFYLSRAEFPSEVSHTLSIHNLCLAFAKQKHKVVLFGIGSKKSYLPRFYGSEDKNLQYCLVNIPKFLLTRYAKWLQLYSFLLAIWSLHYIKKFNPDIIYSRLTILELIFVPKNIPIYYEMHSYGSQEKRVLYGVIFKLLLKYKKIKKIVVTTDNLKEALQEKYKHVEIVNAPLSAEEPVELDSLKLEEIKRTLKDYYKYKFNIGYTGFLDDKDLRGMSTLLDIADKSNGFFIHVVGGNVKMQELWQSRAISRGLKNIKFYGYRSPTEIPYFLESFELVLAPLKYRPVSRAPTGQNMSPLKLAQYMAYSKAIIASDIPSHQDFLFDGVDALLVPYNDIGAWIGAIETVLTDVDLKDKLESAAFDKYLSKYTPKIRVNSILNSLKT